MRVAIIGNGSIGLTLGAFFSNAGFDVTIVTRRELKYDYIKAEGFLSGKYKANFSVSVPEVDAIIVAVKAYSVVDASKKISVDVPVLYIQNGLDILELVKNIVKRPVRAVTGIGAYRKAPNRVYIAGVNLTRFGIDPRGDYKTFVSIRKEADLPYDVGNTEEIERRKAALNAGINPVTALLRIKNGELLKSEAFGVTLAAIDEAKEIAKAYGIELGDLKNAVIKGLERTAENYSSMAMDVMNRRRTEIDFINGKIVEKAKVKGLKAPVNETLRRLVKTLENLYVPVLS